MFELVDTSTSPVEVAAYDPETGILSLVFDWDKLLQASGPWGDARHIDAVTFNGTAYPIEIHPDDGPRDQNGYIYNRDTMENTFSIFVGKGYDPADGTIDLNLTDRANGTGLLYSFELVEEDDPQPPVEVPEGLVYALNAGGAEYTASNGVVYQGDDFGSVRSWTSTVEIEGTEDDTLYQSERSELADGFIYDTAVGNGTYRVELNFAEIYGGARNAGDRVFDVYIEGELAFDNMDVAAAVGFGAAYVVEATTTVSDGSLSIELVSNVENAKLSAFSVWEVDDEVPVDPPEVPEEGPRQLVYALNVGGAEYKATDGVIYQADDLGSVRSWITNAEIAGTEDDTLYQSERYELTGGFSYETVVANGTYEVELNFAEIYGGTQNEGDRVFDVYIEGELAFENLDVAATAGFRTAYDVTKIASVSDGSLSIELVSNVENAKLSAFSIWSLDGSPPSSNLPTLVYALNAGGATYTAKNGVVYGGDDLDALRSWTTNNAISGTEDDALYQSERSERTGGFTYETEVENGFYDVELNFAEIWSGAKDAGQRVFDVFVEGQKVIGDLDIADEAGYLTAIDYIGAVEVADGALTITTSSSVENAKLSGFSIWEAEGVLSSGFEVGSLYDDLSF